MQENQVENNVHRIFPLNDVKAFTEDEAYDLVKRVYKVLVNCSMDYIQQGLENAQGALPKANSLFFTRFGGLD